MSEILQEKIALLEKRVKESSTSPLFAQLAAYYLESGRAEDALRLCDTGLAHHPFYTTGHLIKGKALLALNMKKEAARELEFVADFFPDNPEIKRMLESLQETENPEVQEHEAPGESIPETPHDLQPSVQETSQQGEVLPETSIPSEWAGMLLEEREQSPPPPVQRPSFEYGEVPHSDTFSIYTERPGERSEQPPAFEFSFQTTQPSSDETTPTATFDFGFSPSATEPPKEQPPQLIQEERSSFEIYAARMRQELNGEGTLTLDEFFRSTPKEEEPQFFSPSFATPAQSSDESLSFFSTPATQDVFGSVEEPPVFNPPFAFEEPAKKEEDTIEDLAQKLQGVGRIAPIIDFTKKETPSVSEQDTDVGAGFVTPTLAEIYAKQGWYDDAIKAYRTLAKTKPEERERFEKRIQELEALKNQASSQSEFQ